MNTVHHNSALSVFCHGVVSLLCSGWRIHGQIRFDRATEGTQSTVCRETTRKKSIRRKNHHENIKRWKFGRDLQKYEFIYLTGHCMLLEGR